MGYRKDTGLRRPAVRTPYVKDTLCGLDGVKVMRIDTTIACFQCVLADTAQVQGRKGCSEGHLRLTKPTLVRGATSGGGVKCEQLKSPERRDATSGHQDIDVACIRELRPNLTGPDRTRPRRRRCAERVSVECDLIRQLSVLSELHGLPRVSAASGRSRAYTRPCPGP